MPFNFLLSINTKPLNQKYCIKYLQQGVRIDSNLPPVVQTVDSAIHRINRYPMDNSAETIALPLDSDLSGG